MISNFVIIIIVGIRWMNRDRKIFWGVLIEGSIIFLLWIMLTNIINEKVAVINDIRKIMIIELLFHEISLDIIIISLIVLIVGGAEIFNAMNMNHQNVILGISVNSPLNIRIFRVWYL